jgi:hypothetical protein
MKMKHGLFQAKRLRLLAGIAVCTIMAAIFSISLAGCGTLMNLVLGVEKVETETSKQLLSAANDILLARDNGLTAAQFTAAFEKQFPGLAVSKSPFSHNGVMKTAGTSFKYQEKNYEMEFSGTFTGDSGLTLERLTTATACWERAKKEKKAPETESQ